MLFIPCINIVRGTADLHNALPHRRGMPYWLYQMEWGKYILQPESLSDLLSFITESYIITRGLFHWTGFIPIYLRFLSIQKYHKSRQMKPHVVMDSEGRLHNTCCENSSNDVVGCGGRSQFRQSWFLCLKILSSPAIVVGVMRVAHEGDEHNEDHQNQDANNATPTAKYSIRTTWIRKVETNT